VRARLWLWASAASTLLKVALGLSSCFACAIASAQTTVLAVWDFDCLALTHSGVPETCPLSRAMSEVLASQLLQYPQIQLVERARLREILDEQKLGSSALADEDTRIRLGRIAGAKRMVFGSLITLGGTTRADVRMVSVETSQILTSQDASSKTDELDTAMAHVAQGLVRHLGYNTTSSQKGPATTPVSRAALALFDQGLASMDRKDFDTAIDLFKKALATDPDFKPAERQLQIALDHLTRQ